jgi:muramoyltetrapeptide carboxypeptidase LdcA involved in peptidoglycan recycling
MKKLIKPSKLNTGDKVAAVSLSWGGAGDEAIRWRYAQGKERVEKLLGLKVVEMPNTLASPGFVYEHPEARAADLMAAFADPTIKAVFACIGGDDTIRLLPYIDFDIIHNNPKIFMGYSDTTVNHFMCYKAGLSSIYGPAILSDFAENVQMPEYTIDWLKRTLFSTAPVGEVPPAPIWTSQWLKWVVENKNTARKFEPNTTHELICGSGKATGHLIGGCIEVFDWLRGTELFPEVEDFDGAILFFETSEEMPPPNNLLYALRALGSVGVLKRASGVVFGKPFNNKYYDEYKPMIIKALSEYGCGDLPVLYNLSFGHCEPKFCIPIGAKAEIDCERKSFTILEGAVA